MTVIYLAVLCLGLFGPDMLPADAEVDAEKLRLAGWVFTGIGGVFALCFFAGMFLGRQRWHWTAGALLLAMSLGLLVTAIPGFVLFYFWMQPNVRDWFGLE